MDYFIDTQGKIRHQHFGEGEYASSEKAIQQLLSESGAKAVGQDLVAVDARGVEASADWDNLKSPETYVGYERATSFVSPRRVLDKSQVYAAPAKLRLNNWALSGEWTLKKELATLNKPSGRIVYRFQARDLHLVMGPATRGASVRFRALIDGQAPRADHGIDVNEEGYGTVTEPRMYQLVRQRGPIVDRQFEIEFLNSGVEAYVFTFG